MLKKDDETSVLCTDRIGCDFKRTGKCKAAAAVLQQGDYLHRSYSAWFFKRAGAASFEQIVADHTDNIASFCLSPEQLKQAAADVRALAKKFFAG